MQRRNNSPIGVPITEAAALRTGLRLPVITSAPCHCERSVAISFRSPRRWRVGLGYVQGAPGVFQKYLGDHVVAHLEVLEIGQPAVRLDEGVVGAEQHLVL